MGNRYVSPSLIGAGVVVAALFAYIVGSTLLGSPADFSSVTASTESFRNTLWLQRSLDVMVQGGVVLAGVTGVVVLLRGIRL